MADQSVMPTDYYSIRRRELSENPGAFRASSTITLPDFYGNLETWHVETFRQDGKVTSFVQRNTADGGHRWVLPPEVMAALQRQDSTIDRQSRKRGARKALATKRAEGQQVGNPEALARARKRKKR